MSLVNTACSAVLSSSVSGDLQLVLSCRNLFERVQLFELLWRLPDLVLMNARFCSLVLIAEIRSMLEGTTRPTSSLYVKLVKPTKGVSAFAIIRIHSCSLKFEAQCAISAGVQLEFDFDC